MAMTNPTAPLRSESDGLLGKARNMLTYLKERGLGEPMMVRDLCDELERKQTENAALREQYESCVTCACGRPTWHRKEDNPL